LTIYSAIGFSVAMLVLAASPGPGVFATIARALASGFRPSLAVICGIVLDDIIFLLFAAFGLSMVARALGNMFLIVKICGGAYLIWLGVRIWLKKPEYSFTVGYETTASMRTGDFVSAHANVLIQVIVGLSAVWLGYNVTRYF
jgi:threonine/homoserine/homoserine lactone efflux protein